MQITKQIAAEAVNLFKFRSEWIEESDTVTNISRAFWHENKRVYYSSRGLYDRLLLACVWNAGRVQGVREERRRHKKGRRAAPAASPTSQRT